MIFEKAKGVVRKVTLELVYEVVDERTREIIQRIEELERKREEDFRYLNQKIDTQVSELRNEMRQEIGQLRQEIGQLRQEIAHINRRIDTVIQMLSDLIRNRQ